MEIRKATVVESNPSRSSLPSNTSSGSASYSRDKEIREADKDLNSGIEIEERCGICLLDSARSICSQIDGCKHHFCFVCIMEWAKTESRCPLCKQRFQSIRRPVVPGLFPAEHLVMIPERDQVYHPLGVESTAINETHLDPHCTLCHSTANEAYLVSCALCDLTFHTDCVGLGWDIPEAEFYCPDCHTCRIEYSKMQPDHDDSRYVDQETREKIRMIRRGGDSISIHDLVADIRGEDTTNRPLITQSTGGGSLTSRERMEHGTQALRDNWGRVQSGSLNISDVLRPYRRIEGTSQNNPVATISGAGRENINKESRNIVKSWEMMEKARLDLAKKAAKENRKQITRSSTIGGKTKPTEHIHPPTKKPRPYGEGVSAYNSNHVVSYLNRGFAQFWNNDIAPSGSSYYQPVQQTATMHIDPFGVSSQVPQVGLGVLGRGASSTIEKREFTRSEDVKAEIQSLVKHSLSAIHKDKKKLGSNGYKEVARVSTHTILASYGLVHNEALARSFSRPFCNHNKDMSNLVPGSCHDCFSAFVRQVVEAVLLEKM